MAPKTLRMCMLAERWLKEGNQERYNLRREVMLTRQTEAHEEWGEKVKALKWESQKVLSDGMLYRSC